MAVDVQIRFKASSGEARREMDQLKKEGPIATPTARSDATRRNGIDGGG